MFNWFRRKYVGTVAGWSDVVTDMGTDLGRKVGIWVLYERCWWRGYEKIGDAGTSPLAVERKAMVRAWVMGGKLPPATYARPNRPEKKAEKPAPELRKEGNVIHFPDRTGE